MWIMYILKNSHPTLSLDDLTILNEGKIFGKRIFNVSLFACLLFFFFGEEFWMVHMKESLLRASERSMGATLLYSSHYVLEKEDQCTFRKHISNRYSNSEFKISDRVACSLSSFSLLS